METKLKYNKTATAQTAKETGKHITPPARLLETMVPFRYGAFHGIRDTDIPAFTYTAQITDTIILVRATNAASLKWMGKSGYTAKPIDCKAKTASFDSATLGGALVKSSGLVVSPEHLKDTNLYGGRLDKAEKAWNSFITSCRKQSISTGIEVYFRADTKGFYAVDSDPKSQHFGCLMVSDQLPPSDFDPTKSHIRKWMGINMSYLHGDYDLYGIIDVDPDVMKNRTSHVNQMQVIENKLYGQTQFSTTKSASVSKTINDVIGFELVKHGEQSAYQHEAQDDDVYVFFPSGDVQVIRSFKHSQEQLKYFEDLYRYVFKSTY